MDSSVSVTYIESATMSQRKKTVIDILRDNDDFVSGEAISDVLGISRNAVHKHVKSLRKRGYRIVGVSRRGYRLEDEPARLSMGHVTQRTENTMFGHSFRYHDEIESTNLEAKSLAMKGAPRAPWWSPRRSRPAAAAWAGAGHHRPAKAFCSPSSCVPRCP